MSNRKRLDPWQIPNALAAMQVGVVGDLDNLDLVNKVRQDTHDRVITMTGVSRLSGVRWTVHAGTCETDLQQWAGLLFSDSDGIERVTPDGSPHCEALDRAAIDLLRRCMPYGGIVIASVVVAQSRRRASLS